VTWPGFAARFHPDATWNHRNDDRLGGVKEGVDAIVGARPGPAWYETHERI
jgi:hypothetical protein